MPRPERREARSLAIPPGHPQRLRAAAVDSLALALALFAAAALPACGDSGGQGPAQDVSFGGGGGKPDTGGDPPVGDGAGADLVEGTDGAGDKPDGGEPDGAAVDVPDTVVPDTVDIHVEPDVPFEDPDTGCTPQCEGRQCGPDDCGSICGYCTFGKACNDEFQCIPVCDPLTPCQGKDCGPDGCGGQCGDCDVNFACGEDGLCYPGECEPQCMGEEGVPKTCGPDGCGGVCGLCKGTKLCDTSVGECVDNPCGSVSFAGACENSYTVLACEDGALTSTNCTQTNPTWRCTWNAFGQKFECGKPPDCTPDCSAKQCGDGGCNYSCGECFDGWSCENFQCIPQEGGQCGTIPQIGKCTADKTKILLCVEQKIQILDCAAEGLKCQFNQGAAKYECQ